MTDAQIQELVAVLREALRLIELPSNDFTWSTWENTHEAVSEIALYVKEIESGNFNSTPRLHTLFGPTGAIQEVSLSSGWGDLYIDLPERFDNAIEPRIQVDTPNKIAPDQQSNRPMEDLCGKNKWWQFWKK